jgi:hypothetical protein
MSKLSSPFGTAFLGARNDANLKLWGEEGVGDVPIEPTVCSSGQCPFYHVTNTTDAFNSTPIHLLIASFRDQLCPRTLFNLFSRAQNASRVFVRVYQQTIADSDLPDDADCWHRYCQVYNVDCMRLKQNVRIVTVDANKAKGPTDARSKLSAMVHWDFTHRTSPSLLDFAPVHLQDFCMETDSHMDFSDNWDNGLMEMFHRTENDYAVLSTYVASMADNNQDVRTVPHLCMVTFTSTIRNWGTKQCQNLIRPKLTNAMWGAGLSFHRCHAELNVPVDPYLDNVFDGEEASRGFRFFTHGYDVYTPDRVLVTHDYEGHQSNPIVHSWGRSISQNANIKTTSQQDSWVFTNELEAQRHRVKVIGTERVNLLLGIGAPDHSTDAVAQAEVSMIRNSRYGLGTKRTLEQAVEFTGIDLQHRRMVKNKCGNLLWVPFEESPEYGVPDTLARSYAGEPIALTAVDASASRRDQAMFHPGLRSDVVDGSAPGLGSTTIVVLACFVLLAFAAIRILSPRFKKKVARHRV